ncbi:uncharacterized protein BKA78DRAFT_132529 [Phyllosticta capitalensis]|uniref:uncharacterized protein n=1 Tax=Phyllosticta capitalensis TaxID=121624 RepID=UPI00312EECD3
MISIIQDLSRRLPRASLGTGIVGILQIRSVKARREQDADSGRASSPVKFPPENHNHEDRDDETEQRILSLRSGIKIMEQRNWSWPCAQESRADEGRCVARARRRRRPGTHSPCSHYLKYCKKWPFLPTWPMTPSSAILHNLGLQKSLLASASMYLIIHLFLPLHPCAFF